MAKMVLEGELHVYNNVLEPDGGQFRDAVLQWCRENLTVPNPDYASRQRLGLYTGRTPKTLALYRERPDEIVLPYGVIFNLSFRTLCTSRIKMPKYQPRVIYNAKIPLYDYQEQAVQALLARGGGILQSKAGSGKTRCGIALINKIESKTLWLTHTSELLEQSYRAAAEFFDEALLGKITGGKVNIGAGVTFATVQTMQKIDLSQYKREWDCIIVDECHRVAGTPTRATMFSRVLNALTARHKYGLSATLHRSDGLIKCVMYMLGGVAHTVPDDAVNVMTAEVRRRETPVRAIPDGALDTDGTIVYSRYISILAELRARNEVIVRDMIENCGHYNLLLSDRKAQLYEIYDLLPADIQSQTVILHGGTKKQERQEMLAQISARNKNYLLSTYQLAKEGLDIPCLDRLYLGTPIKDYATTVQSVGRVTRIAQGKDTPVIYDYVDGCGLSEKMYKERARHYRKSGCKIIHAGVWK